MNRVFQILLFSAVGVLMVAHCRGDAAQAELATRSEWWPDRVTVNEPITSTLNGRVIKPGRLGFVIRMDAEDVLMDYGRFGLVRVPVSKTNFVELSEELREKRTWTDTGIWTLQLHTKLMEPIENGFRPSPIEVYEPIDYFILIYLDTQTKEGQKLLAWMRDSEAIQGLSENQMLAMVPGDDDQESFYLELIAYEYPGRTLVHPMAKPYRTILQHDPGVAALTVIDKNGRQVTPVYSISQDSDLDKVFDQLQRQISQDVEIRKTFSQSE